MNDQTSTPISFDRAELKRAIRHDTTMFFAFYLEEKLTMEVPEIHDNVWNEILQMLDEVNYGGLLVKVKKLFAIPRGFAKTTVAKLAVVLFLRYTRFRFVVYASKTVGHGKNAIRDIVGYLTSKNCKSLYGDLIQIKSNDQEALWIFDMPLRDFDSEEITYKRIIFKAAGANTHIRGFNLDDMRPEIIVVDDIEDNDNTTIDLQPKLDEWFLGAFMKAFATSHVLLMIGNMIRSTTLLARLSKDVDWNPTVYGAIVLNKETGVLESLWEEKFPLRELIKEYRMFRKLGKGHVWEVEMMNLSQDEIFVLSMVGAIRPPDPVPEDLEAGLLIIDPKFGESAFTDDTAITVHARIKNVGVPVIIDHYSGKIIEEQIFEQALLMSYRWGISTWIIESDAAQRILIPYFILLMQDRKLNPAAFALIPVSSNRVQKSARITSMKSAIASGSYAVSESQDEIINQFVEYKIGQRHEDLIDSASHGLQVWNQHGTSINQRGITIQLFRIAAEQPDHFYDAEYESDIAAF